jgi:4-amino-4-deoxy-L-arabinose transferase-like glycosyltransferase
MPSATPTGSDKAPTQETSISRGTTKSSFLFSPFWMVVVGLALRVACIVFGGLYKFQAFQWLDLEVANIGRSLALGHGFSSPWPGSIGPTAWTAPVYPWLVSLAFRIFGVFSFGAAFAMLTFNSVFSALTSWTIYRIARRVFDENTAVWSGWAWALFAYPIYWSVIWIWDTTLSAFLLSLLFMLTLEMEDDDRLGHWSLYGLLWGVAALTNTSVLSWLPFSGCWLAYRLHRSGKRFLVPAILGAVVFWAAITPWLVRNYVVFDKLILIRGDLGSEFRTGNNPLAEGTFVPSQRAGGNSALAVEYNQMGEAAWVAEQGRIARKWIAENPQRFLELSCRRAFLFWSQLPERLSLAQPMRILFMLLMLLPFAGLFLAIRRRVHGVFLFATLLVFYPTTYYITFATPRYRHPIEPELVILAVWLFAAEAKSSKSSLQNHSA